MGNALVDGRPVPLDAAVTEAARLLRASRSPLIAGLGTDVAGARAAIALAQRIGAAVDHMHSRALMADLEVMRESGMMVTTPSEARLRGDTLLLVGPGLAAAWPELAERLLARPLGAETGEGARRIIWLCPGRGGGADPAVPGAQVIAGEAANLPAVLAGLRAHLGGRPSGSIRISGKALDALVADLRTARFGVAVWSAAELDVLTIDMLCGLVGDLNAQTRFTGLPLAPGDNAVGVTQVCGWMTGFPMRTGFARGYPEHDPWRFDAERLVASGEADCVVWISAYRPAVPPWRSELPVIALAPSDAAFAQPPRVHIAVGQPGLDHAAIHYLPAFGMLGAVPAARQSDAPAVAAALAGIAGALGDNGVWPC
jgi:formylmethanofuran dehydrogenase subunit B